MRADEAVADASLATARDPGTGYLARRIKHFSGYDVVSGFSDSEERQ